MRIGVLADIHGNETAFRACVDYLVRAECEEFLLLGDFVSDTAGAEDTMRILYELAEKYPCRMLRGNREEYLLEQQKIRRGEAAGELWLANSASGNLLYTYEHLTERDFAFFDRLPISFRYERKGFPAITCCHGSPQRAGELLGLSGERVREVLEEIDTGYLIAAHTHYPGILEYQGKTYINTGSCGISIGDPGYAHGVLLESAGEAWKPQLLRIPFDTEAVIRRIFASGLYDMAPWFLNNNIHILVTGIDKTPDLVKLAGNLQERVTGQKTVWPHIEEKYFKQAAEQLEIPDYSYMRNHHRAKDSEG